MYRSEYRSKKMVKSTGTKVENDKRTERQRALKIAHNFEFSVWRMGCSSDDDYDTLLLPQQTDAAAAAAVTTAEEKKNCCWKCT